MTKKLLVLAGAMTLASAAHSALYTYNADWSFNFSDPVVKVTGGGLHAANVYAGVIGAKRKGGDVPNNWLGGIGSSIGTYCAELNQDIIIPRNYTHNVEVLNGSGSQHTIGSMPTVTFDYQRTLRLEKLWGNFNPTNPTSQAAFQLAQWNILFDSNADTSITGGNFFATGNASILSQANSILSTLDSKTTLATVFLLSSLTAQDQIWGTTTPGGPPPGTTPEPFTMSLGLASAGMFVRRRLKAKRS